MHLYEEYLQLDSQLINNVEYLPAVSALVHIMQLLKEEMDIPCLILRVTSHNDVRVVNAIIVFGRCGLITNGGLVFLFAARDCH